MPCKRILPNIHIQFLDLTRTQGPTTESVGFRHAEEVSFLTNVFRHTVPLRPGSLTIDQLLCSVMQQGRELVSWS